PDHRILHSLPTRRSSDLKNLVDLTCRLVNIDTTVPPGLNYPRISQLLASELKELGVTPTVSVIPDASMRRKVSPEVGLKGPRPRSEEHTSELQSLAYLVC